MRSVRALRYRRRLRRLQSAYYDASEKNDAVIAEYLAVLAEAREEELRVAGGGGPLTRVHIGSGGHYIRGWINVDLEPTPPVDVAANAGQDLPFRSASIDRIHSEDFLEHMDHAAGKHFLAEAFRVLRSGGVMRLLTPDLRALVKRSYLRPEERHLKWCSVYLGAHGPCEALNMHLRMNGEHLFIYDEEHLRDVLRETGFEVRRVRYNQSSDPHLRFLDLRDFGLNLFLECIKP
jgi:predicted SAM-dependent methyltransferase